MPNRNRPHRVPWRTATVVASLTLLAACNGSPSNATASASDPDSPTATNGSPAPTAPTTGAEAATLEDFLGRAALFIRGPGGGAFDSDGVEQEQQLIQQEIQACMLAQGFEYVPEEVADGPRAFVAAADRGLSPEEFAASEGFGVSTRFDALFAGDIDLGDDEPNPNDELLATLSDGEADAWLLALRGEPPQRNDQGQLVDPGTGEVLQGGPGARATGGCRLRAQEVVRGDLTVLADLADAWEELEERIAADPRITEIARSWSACMFERGFDYQDEADARADFSAQFRPLLRSFVQGVDSGGGQAAGGVIAALAEQGLTGEQEAELQALQDLEIAAAVAAVECDGGTDDEVAEIVAGYEAEFIDQNRTQLEAFAN